MYPNADGRRHRVLMISHAFPPLGGSGVQRSAKFAKYLPQFEWTPLIWTARNVPDLPRDETLLSDLPADVLRFERNSPHPLLAVENALCAATRPLGAKAGGAVRWRARRILRAVAELSVPDPAAAWAMRSLLPALRACRRHRVDALYSTFSPASNHLLAWMVKRCTGLPWVADFRDLWVDNYDFDQTSRMRRFANRRLQRAFLRSADAVVGVSAEQTDILAAHRPSERVKFFTITNGADLDDFADRDRTRVREELGIRPDRFVISYVGSFVASSEAPAMVDAVALLSERLPSRGPEIEFRVCGWVPAEMERYIRESPVAPTLTGYVSHGRAIREMLAADVLLSGSTVSGPNADTVIPAKVFEYMAAGRPIIHVGTVGRATDEIVSQCHNCVTEAPDADRIADRLAALMSRWSPEKPLTGCDPDRLAPFTRRSQTQSLANVLTGCLHGATQPRTDHPGFDRPGGLPAI